MPDSIHRLVYLRPTYAAVTITGDLPDGYVGEGTSGFAYTMGGGRGTKTASLYSGALPAGLTLNADGTVTGTRTGGSAVYSWEVVATDEDGSVSTPLADSSETLITATLLTNRRNYFGEPDALTMDTVANGFGGTHSRISPDGRYCVVSDPGDTNTDRFQFFKWDALDEEWDVLADPAVLPDEGPREMAWSPDGIYCAAVCDNGALARTLFIYKRTGDTFAALAESGNYPTWGMFTVIWDSEGERLAITGESSADKIMVYDFASDTLTNERTDGSTPGSRANWIAFQAGSGSQYIAAGSDDRIYVEEDDGASLTRVAQATGSEWEVCASGIYWSGSYLISVSDDTNTTRVGVFLFTGSGLTFIGAAADQPAGAVSDSSLSSDGLFLALAHSSGNLPMLYEITPGAPPVLTKLADVSSTGVVVNSVSWRNV